MKAAVIESFKAPLKVQNVPEPEPGDHSLVIKVEANSICRSDWHTWNGHFDEIELPHVPGHELAGVVEAIGRHVRRWKPGDRLTTPFVGGCGSCHECLSGNHQVCSDAEFIGFSRWGSFAEYCEVPNADINGVALPDEIDFVSGASLGCRFVTAYRAIIDQGQVRPGEWVAIHGCGGVGLSAIMIASAAGARVIGVDINPDALDIAESIGADMTMNARDVEDVPEAILDLTGGGADMSVDALGRSITLSNSISCLKTRGRHIQVGVLAGDDANPSVLMDAILYKELRIIGSYGMQAYRYPALLQQISSGDLQPQKLITNRVGLEEVTDVFQSMDHYKNIGITVIDRF
jgi:alcohol dehydrogenase